MEHVTNNTQTKLKVKDSIMHLNSELMFRKYAVPYFAPNSKILEVGPAGFPSAFQKLVNDPSIEWHTIDFPNSSFISAAVTTLTYHLNTPYDFPIADGVYDLVVSGQVIEHVQKIWLWMKELKRVTKKGGRVITINPVSWPYHEAPIDCWRIFPKGMSAIAEEVELEMEQCLFESLEIEQIRQRDPKARFIAGEAYNYDNTPQKISTILMWNKLIRKVPHFRYLLEIPIEVAYDTISVMKKIS